MYYSSWRIVQRGDCAVQQRLLAESKVTPPAG